MLDTADVAVPQLGTGPAADVASFIQRFMVMGSDALAVTAVWVIHTHCFVAFPQTPYLAVTSPEKQCGKSRLLDLLELIVREPWAAILPSEAVVFRKIEQDQPTLLLDEVDTIFNPKTGDRYEGLRAILNSGHRRGARVPRCVGPTHQVADFSTFCPKVLAGIGTLPDTVADRSIPIRLERRTRDQPLERFFRRDAEPVATALRDQIEAWCSENIDRLSAARPTMPDELSDREQEGCEVLVAIADLLGCGTEIRGSLVELLATERQDNGESMRLTLLRDLRTIFAGHPGVLHGFTSSLLTELVGMEEAPWSNYYGHPLTARDMGSLLARYGIGSAQVRLGDKTAKGYRRVDLEPAWARYLGDA